MFISKLSLVNYRNFSNATLPFKKGINTVIGENGSGKTNLFRAIRLLLDDNLLRSAYKLDERDFHRGLKPWQGHWIIISIEFQELSEDEAIQSLFLHGTGNAEGQPLKIATYNLIFRPRADVRLALSKLPPGDEVALSGLQASITIDNYETVFTGKSTADFNDPKVYKTIVGDFAAVVFPTLMHPSEVGAKLPALLSVSNEVAFTHVQALRDVVSDFKANRTNPLLTLLKSKTGELDAAQIAPITAMVRNLNAGIEQLKDVQLVRTDILATVKEAVGEAYSPASLSIKSDLPEEAEQLFQALNLFVGESDDGHEGAIHDLSLGGANMIYLTLKLLEFRYRKKKESFANFLLVEEPEAHIHTHIQKTLFDRINYSDTQIIYSTHSTQISEVSNVESMNILGKSGGRVEAFQPGNKLSPSQLVAIQRYLDAVRCNLLFARSVILVEGDAEEILIPVLVKKVLGLTLDELGVSLVNIRSTGFANVALLFHTDRIRKRCAIVTDLDAAFVDITANPADSEAQREKKRAALASQTSGLTRKTQLDAFVAGNPYLQVFYSPHTFEVDFVATGNSEIVVDSLPDIYTHLPTIGTATDQLRSANIAEFGTRTLTLAEAAGKGWFAILLAKRLTANSKIPDHIVKALFFAHGQPSRAIWAKVLSHRLEILAADPVNTDHVTALKTGIQCYLMELTELPAVISEFTKWVPNDEIIRIAGLV